MLAGNPPARPTTFRGRLLFIGIGAGHVVIDGMAAPAAVGGETLPPEAPFALDVDLPWSKWGLAVMSTLGRWAVHHQAVDIDFRPAPEGLQARLSSGDCWMKLDVRSSTGLSGRSLHPSGSG